MSVTVPIQNTDETLTRQGNSAQPQPTPKLSDNIDMKQQSLNPSEFSVKPKRTRKREFLDEMDAVVPWRDLVRLIELFAPKLDPKNGIATVAVDAP